MKREQIDNLIVYLVAVASTAKDIHYTCSGNDFYGKHLFADKIYDNINEYIDRLKEVCLLGHKYAPLNAREYYKEAIPEIPYNADFESIRDLMIKVLALIEQINGVSKGDENLLGAIAEDIQNNVGLINIMYGD